MSEVSGHDIRAELSAWLSNLSNSAPARRKRLKVLSAFRSSESWLLHVLLQIVKEGQRGRFFG